MRRGYRNCWKEKEKEYAAEVKRVQVECTSETMSLELQLEEMLKTIEQKDKFITKQMMSLRKYMAHDIACFTFQVQQAGKMCVTQTDTQDTRPTHKPSLASASRIYKLMWKQAFSIREYAHYKQASKEGDWTRCKRQNQKKDTASC
ncbi:hypothetical protein PROFUN_16116 [Planoprotostelium fungivorum]|uniref:Uncharacterized protein n=1 Tax=Planoprotostelium fungivorum TaxID=1890364 RepID=A0A2P6MSL7_9EUKA|nr:hypothetical protein PROFUN_16116 [Planoprotostelium fungivorum]